MAGETVAWRMKNGVIMESDGSGRQYIIAHIIKHICGGIAHACGIFAHFRREKRHQAWQHQHISSIAGISERSITATAYLNAQHQHQLYHKKTARVAAAGGTVFDKAKGRNNGLDRRMKAHWAKRRKITDGGAP